MPTYEYVCAKCGHAFEKFQAMADKALTVCPKDLCPQKTWGKGKVQRQISAGAGLLFKGSGFYITDYRSEHYKQAAKKDQSGASTSSTPAPSSSSSSSSTGGESKPKPTESKPAGTTTPKKP